MAACWTTLFLCFAFMGMFVLAGLELTTATGLVALVCVAWYYATRQEEKVRRDDRQMPWWEWF
jgi:L-asparagine transporter-like permease